MQLPCNIVLPPCTLLTNSSSLGRSISNNDIGIDFLAVDVAAIQDRNE